MASVGEAILALFNPALALYCLSNLCDYPGSFMAYWLPVVEIVPRPVTVLRKDLSQYLESSGLEARL